MKILFTDIDGTLYDRNCILPRSTVEAIKLFKAKGNLLYMTTGRSKAENKQEIWDLGFDGMICGNGAYIEDHGQIIYTKPIVIDDLNHIFTWLKSRNIEYLEETRNGLFASENLFKVAKPPLTHRYGNAFDDYFASMSEGVELLRDDVDKISFYLNNEEDLKLAKQEFKQFEVDAWGNGDGVLFGEIFVKGHDKGKAVKMLVEKCNYDIKDTIAFGDANQDIPMLEYCGLGLTFSSGSEDIKKIADYVSDSVNENGFYKALKHFDLI